MIEEIGGITLTDKFWDCDCEEHYIHPRSQEKCEKCGAEREDCPDSRVSEVFDEYGCDVKV